MDHEDTTDTTFEHDDATDTTRLNDRIEQLEAQISEIQQLDQRIRLVLTEVRGLAAKFDRFARTRVRGSG